MNVCSNCFNDVELKSYIDTSLREIGDCPNCKSESVLLLPIKELVDFFSELLDLFTPDGDGIEVNKILQEDWNLFANEAIANKILMELLANIDHEIKAPSEKVSYIPDINENISFWDKLKNDVKWQRRYLLELKNIEDFGWDSFFNETVTYTDSERFFRARIHYKENETIFPIDKMGSPPKEEVGSGRANPQGIPYLYLSKSTKTTLFETRALFRDEISVGEFKVKDGNRLEIVDFTEKASAFLGSGNLVGYTKKIKIKKAISRDLSKPIRRYDSDIEYIPTQFICEYIRYVIGAEGILFNSSLDLDGKNVVLFSQDKLECINVKKHMISNLDIDFEEVTP